MIKCDMCGTLWDGKRAELYEGDVICPNCANHLGYCPTCELAQICLFETSTSPLPKVTV